MAKACSLLSSIAKHFIDLVKVEFYTLDWCFWYYNFYFLVQLIKCYLQIVVATGVFPAIFMSLKDTNPQVSRNTTIVIREVCKHTVELAQLVFSDGGGATIVENVQDTYGSERRTTTQYELLHTNFCILVIFQ